ncbi:hypothetical protein [Streptomyces botrytidirepellens]|uniref:Uncharacterized protein n=1 Tax=Streptomyces botrytidirepellens TaxID=2486417 RepID=A0A3M8WY16_9ACTN|nr:hypothetical protein [Streptomyces botrytidirepellens]RNG33591.1 hypothetical protein EEJ42_07265 [Streptomyces botrytidirepellens]
MSVQVCARCQTTTRQPVVVAIGHGASAGGVTVYACPDCAPSFPKQRDPFDGTILAHRDTQPGSAGPGRDQK